MKEKRILEALSEINDEFVEEKDFETFAESKSIFRENIMLLRLVVAASIAIILLAVTQIPEKNKGAEFSAQTLGYQSICLENESQLITKNPWDLSSEIKKLPVYKNLAFVSPAGAPAYFSKEELLEKAMKIAEKLDVELIEWRYEEIPEESKYSDVIEICAQTDIAEISVSGNGSVAIEFYEGVELPKEYQFSDTNSAEEAEAIVYYLLDAYKELLQMENPTVDCRVSYDLQGGRSISYAAFEKTEEENALLGYCFQQVTFLDNMEGKLYRIHFGDVRQAAEYLGAYEIINAEEAKERFASGNYSYMSLSSAMFEDITEEDIAKVELLYLTGSACKYYQPYYCFYVEYEMNGLITYNRYYVPALSDENLLQYMEEYPLGN